jgi:hypothetical protein
MNQADKHQTDLRFLPEQALPPYTYVPGKTPHPESHPAGHSFGRARATAPVLDATQWRQSTAYLRGLDLFNAGYYWESHVELESLWLAAGRKGEAATFLKALIHLAACGVKHLEGIPAGVASHAGRAARLLFKLRPALENRRPLPFGIPLADLVHMAMSMQSAGWPEDPPKLVPVRE